MATYVIGDVHGQYDALLRLLKKIRYREDRDELWFVGDLVNRGPKSLEVLRYVCARAENCKVVLGNHDFSLLVEAVGDPAVGRKKTTAAILAAPDGAALVGAMHGWPMMVVDRRRRVIMAHAGLYPGWTLATTEALAREVTAAMTGENAERFLLDVYRDEPSCWSQNLRGMARRRFAVNAFTRMRYLTRQGCLALAAKMSPEAAPKHLIPWYERCGEIPFRCVFGHWAALGVRVEKHWACLDGGAAWNGALIAFDLDHWAVAASVPVAASG